MAAAKKPAGKRKIQACDVVVGSRVEAAMADLAKVMKECAVRSARAAERPARAAELAQIALTTIASVLQDLRRLAGRTDDRLAALEKAAAE
jgi:hypothetical protein